MVVDFFIILVIALLIASIFFYGFNRRGPWGAFWVFLLILFLAAWAGRLWIASTGPQFYGYGWLPVILWVFVVAAAIGMASGTTRAEGYREVTEREELRGEPDATDVGGAIVLGTVFWVIFTVLLAAIIAGLLV